MPPPPPSAPEKLDETLLARLPAVLAAGGGEMRDDTPLHHHPGDELVLLERGEAWIHADGRELALRGPALVLVPQGVVHDQRNAPGTWSWYCIHRSRSHPLRPPLRALQLAGDDPLLAWFPSFCRYHGSLAAAASGAGAPLVQAMLAHVQVLDRHAGTARSLPRAVAAAVAHIEANLAGELDASALARAAGVSPSHLRALVRRHLGTSPQELHRRRRLDLAARLLATTHLAVHEVAAACGWRDPDHFTRLFTRRFQGSPRRWRLRKAAETATVWAGGRP